MFVMVGRYEPFPMTSTQDATPEQVLRVIAERYRVDSGQTMLTEGDWEVVYELSKRADVLSAVQDQIDELVREEDGGRPADELVFRDPYTGDLYPTPAGTGILKWVLPLDMLAGGHTADGSAMAFQQDNALLVATPADAACWFWAHRGRLFMTTDDHDMDDVPALASEAIQREARLLATLAQSDDQRRLALAQARSRFV